jgi:hypothetical protein
MANHSDVLLWLSAVHYPSVDSFVREACEIGVSLRIQGIPSKVRPGKSLLFLAHDEASVVVCSVCRGRGVTGRRSLRVRLLEKVDRKWRLAADPLEKSDQVVGGEVQRTVKSVAAYRDLRESTFKRSARQLSWEIVPNQKLCSACNARGVVPEGKVFACCVIERVEMVFDCASAAREYEDRIGRFGKRPAIPLSYVAGGYGTDTPRRYGYRDIGGLYLSSSGDLIEQQKVADKIRAEMRGPLVILSKPVPYARKRCVGMQYVSRTSLLGSSRRG